MKRLMIAAAVAATIAGMTLAVSAQGQGEGQGQDTITICHVPSAGHDLDYCGRCRPSKLGDADGKTMTLPRVAAVNGLDVEFGRPGPKLCGPEKPHKG
jgi:hypothetical protein